MLIRRLVFWFLLVIAVGHIGGPVVASGPRYTVRQRFGVDIVPRVSGIPNFPGKIADYAGADALGFGWYSNWTYSANPERPNGIEFVQLLDVKGWPPNWNGVRGAVQAIPGATWLIGNEPETRGQGELTPSVYAARYHEAYYFIKGIDPTAQIAIGGVVMPSPLRLKWLELCLQSYQETYNQPMPIEVWNIHAQILREDRFDWGCGIPFGLSENQGRLYTIQDNASVEAFQQLMREFRTWLYERGERNKPVIISEYGVLMPDFYVSDQGVLDFMRGTFDFMLQTRDPRIGWEADEYRLIQRWAWFSLNCPFWGESPYIQYNGGLYRWQQPSQLTVFGQFYRSYAQRGLEARLPILLRQQARPVPTLPATYSK